MRYTCIKEIKIQPELDLEPLRKLVREQILNGTSKREEKGEFPLKIYELLHKMGYFQAAVPEHLGGIGASTTDLIWITREIAYGSAGVASSITANLMGVLPVLLYGSDQLKYDLAKQFLSKLTFSSFCWTEPDTGSDVFRIKTKAVRTDNGYLISGKKCFISNANYADRFVVMARVEDAEPRCALTLFYIPEKAKGLTTGNPLKKLGQSDSNTSEVYFDNVFVPNECRLQSEGDGPKIAIHCLQRNRTLFSAAAIGLCQRAQDIGQNYLANRILYGKPLLSQPTIQSLLAQLYTEMQAAWFLVCNAAACWDAGINQCKYSSMAKYYSGHTAVKLTNEILELFGGYGYTKEYEIERLYRDAKLFEIIEGPSFVQQAIIAKELFSELGVKDNVVPFKQKAA